MKTIRFHTVMQDFGNMRVITLSDEDIHFDQRFLRIYYYGRYHYIPYSSILIIFDVEDE